MKFEVSDDIALHCEKPGCLYEHAMVWSFGFCEQVMVEISGVQSSEWGF